MRVVDGKETANFWDIEKPEFAIEQGPPWLKIDPATGLLSGTPDAAGKVDVAVTVTIDQEVRKLDDEQTSAGAREGDLNLDRAGGQRDPAVRHRGARLTVPAVSARPPSSGGYRPCSRRLA